MGLLQLYVGQSATLEGKTGATGWAEPVDVTQRHAKASSMAAALARVLVETLANRVKQTNP